MPKISKAERFWPMLQSACNMREIHWQTMERKTKLMQRQPFETSHGTMPCATLLAGESTAQKRSAGLQPLDLFTWGGSHAALRVKGAVRRHGSHVAPDHGVGRFRSAGRRRFAELWLTPPPCGHGCTPARQGRPAPSGKPILPKTGWAQNWLGPKRKLAKNFLSWHGVGHEHA
jgi:hypothetical protein